jgi:preprotein translocase subunit SecE
LRDSTVVVIATVILLTTFVFVVDRILQVGLKVLLR